MPRARCRLVFSRSLMPRSPRRRPDAYDAVLALGNVFQQGIRDILASEAYAESLRRDARLVQRFCDGCEYRGACNTIPIFESPRKAIGGRRCGIAYPLYGYVER